MKSRLLGLLLLAAGIELGLADEVSAQMFGNRQMGGSLMRQPAAGGGEFAGNVGMVQGNERFIRGNRAADAFVGGGGRDAGGFVGQVNAANIDASRVPTTLGTPRQTNRAPQINRPMQRHRPNTLHYPPVELGFQPEPEQVQQLAAAAEQNLDQSLGERFGNRIEVSVEGRTAILQGEVDDAASRRLAELMAGFEPGISEVRNQLQVRSGAGK